MNERRGHHGPIKQLWLALALAGAFATSPVDAAPADDDAPQALAPPLPAAAIARLGELAGDDAKFGGTYRLAFSPDGKTLVTRDLAQQIIVWDIATGEKLHVLGGHEGRVDGLVISPDGNYLLTSAADPDEEARLWDLASGEKVRGIPGGAHLGHFLPDRTTLTLVTETRITHYDLVTGAILAEFPEVRIPLAISPDGMLMAAIRRLDADQIIVVETKTGREKYVLPGLPANPVAVEFTPDGSRLAATVREKRDEPPLIRVWDLAQQKVVATLAGHEQIVQDLDYSSDGRFLASASWDQTIRLWEVASEKEIATLKGHQGHVVCVAFSLDGRRLASGSSGKVDGTAIVWDVRQAIAPSRLPPEKVDDAALATLWSELGSEEPKTAFTAAGTLATAGDVSLAFIKSQFADLLKPAPADVVEKLIEQLDSDNFAAREQATAELIRLRDTADTLLRKALAESASPEVRFRINQILDAKQPETKLTPDEWRRMRRLVYALELMSAPGEPAAADAREFLKVLSLGHPDVKVMQEAAAAVKRAGK